MSEREAAVFYQARGHEAQVLGLFRDRMPHLDSATATPTKACMFLQQVSL